MHPIRLHAKKCKQLVIFMNKELVHIVATAKITIILWGVDAKAVWAPNCCSGFRFASIHRSCLIDANAARHLRKLVATVIAKLETDATRKNGRINRRQLLLSLKLLGSFTRSRSTQICCGMCWPTLQQRTTTATSTTTTMHHHSLTFSLS